MYGHTATVYSDVYRTVFSVGKSTSTLFENLTDFYQLCHVWGMYRTYVLYDIFHQTQLYREVGLELNGANVHLIVRHPFLSLSHPPTPPQSRSPDFTTLPSLAKFQVVWRRLCEALLSSSSLAGQNHPPMLSIVV